MDEFSMHWEGLKELATGLEKIAVDVDLAAKVTVSKSGALLVQIAQNKFQGSHRAGSPRPDGGAGPGGTGIPMIVTGYLRRSIVMSPINRIGRGHYLTSVGPTAIYGRRVELGLDGSAKYPFFGPAVDEATPEFVTIRDEAFAAALR